MHHRSVVIFIFIALFAASCSRLHTRGEPTAEAAKAPDFSLPDANGATVSLDGLLAKGPAVLVFYRGYW